MLSDKGTYILTGLHFKPEFSGKPEGGCRSTSAMHWNDWMENHHFDEDIKVQRFSLTLLGEARLWYQSLEPLGRDYMGTITKFF